MIHRDNWLAQPELLAKRIEKDCLVKINNGAERFYVLVIRTKQNGEIVGRVSNLLVYAKPYKKDDLVAFKAKHAFEILTADERTRRQEELLPVFRARMVEYVNAYFEHHGRYPTEQESLEHFESTMNTRMVPAN